MKDMSLKELIALGLGVVFFIISVDQLMSEKGVVDAYPFLMLLIMAFVANVYFRGKRLAKEANEKQQLEKKKSGMVSKPRQKKRK